MTPKQAFDILLSAYEAEVEYRHREFIKDNAISNIQKVANYLTSENPKFGILLCGKCGNGKTTMIYAFQLALNYLSGIHILDGNEIRIMDAKDINLESKDPKIFLSIKSSDMLGVEDMGREATEVLDFGNVLNPVIDLLEYRYNNQLFTFITTNLTPKEIREKYGKRIADRFNEMMDVIVFENETYRGR